MKLFLKKTVSELGEIGDVIDVKPGYARNYLIPQGIGVEVGQANLQWIDAQKRRLEQEETERNMEMRSLAEKIDGASCTVIARATEEGHLFGSVTVQTISDQLAADGVEFDPDLIDLEKPIKELGIYNLTVRVHPEFETSIKVWVVKADEDDIEDDAPADEQGEDEDDGGGSISSDSD
ncbi:MAG: 50S ribosomal protein L9 [Planctomycetota bacterium]|nr:50S ribosomal protein L9 [Planctomycetota bacterium]